MNLVNRYHEIMNDYYDGNNSRSLSIYEILEEANEKDLFERMSVEDIQTLLEESTGFSRMMFISILNKKTSSS